MAERSQTDVALADSNPLMLSALSEFFDRDPRFSLVTAEGFLEAVLRVPVAVGVIDWTLPMLGGEKLIEVLRAQESAPRVVVYSHSEGQDIPRKAMAAKAAQTDSSPRSSAFRSTRSSFTCATCLKNSTSTTARRPSPFITPPYTHNRPRRLSMNQVRTCATDVSSNQQPGNNRSPPLRQMRP